MSLPLIIVPVFNAFEYLQPCLQSIERTVPDATRVLIIDDASTDQRVRPFLESWRSSTSTHCQLLIHEHNQGFVASVNHGMRLADSDVVLLNSDTELSRGSLQRMQTCLQSSRSIATVTPWSNNGEIVSIPIFCASNPLPPDPDTVADAIASCGSPIYPEMPTAVGFCMAVSRIAMEKLGLFDEQTFGKGYGEENPIAMNTLPNGGWNKEAQKYNRRVEFRIIKQGKSRWSFLWALLSALTSYRSQSAFCPEFPF